jgi:hypothetical protein
VETKECNNCKYYFSEINELKQQLQQSQARERLLQCQLDEEQELHMKTKFRERVLQEENDKLLAERQNVDIVRNELIKALERQSKMRDRERVLREALEELSYSSWVPARDRARETLKEVNHEWKATC